MWKHVLPLTLTVAALTVQAQSQSVPMQPTQFQQRAIANGAEVHRPIETNWGNQQQQEKYLTLLAGEKVGAYALSEAGSGSDAFAMQTRAVDKGDHFLLNGQKLWITNGNEAEIFVLFANANPEAVRT